jgi:hypothetical protein
MNSTNIWLLLAAAGLGVGTFWGAHSADPMDTKFWMGLGINGVIVPVCTYVMGLYQKKPGAGGP